MAKLASNKPIETAPPPPQFVFGPGYTFRLRPHIGGPFKGLWELVLVDLSGDVKEMISDADILDNCLDNLTGIFQRDGL